MLCVDMVARNLCPWSHRPLAAGKFMGTDAATVLASQNATNKSHPQPVGGKGLHPQSDLHSYVLPLVICWPLASLPGIQRRGLATVLSLAWTFPTILQRLKKINYRRRLTWMVCLVLDLKLLTRQVVKGLHYTFCALQGPAK